MSTSPAARAEDAANRQGVANTRGAVSAQDAVSAQGTTGTWDAAETIDVYDTTLRDGAQQEGMNLTVADKIAIAPLLDELGVTYIEGGWPGAIQPPSM